MRVMSLQIPTLPKSASSNNEVLNPDGSIKPLYTGMIDALEGLGHQQQARWATAKHQSRIDGLTFPLVPRQWRVMPTDWLPRLISATDWQVISRGVEQRLRALNKFLLELYCGKQSIVPDKVVYSSINFHPELRDVRPAKDVFVHIYGVDLVHLGDGTYTVLEDNLRIPSGISYQLKCLEITQNNFPEFQKKYHVLPYDVRQKYLSLFASLSDSDSPVSVILTDGKYGPAYFEHRYLSELLGIPLVEGSDLHIGNDGRVFARANSVEIPVDVIYRRIEDVELFVPGLTEAYRNNKVALVNGLGNGVADDKLVFLWVPEMIRRYLGEEPAIQQAKSYHLLDADSRSFALQNLERLVLKTRDGYGGLGVYIMPDLGSAYRTGLAKQIVEKPQAFIAQDTLEFSKHLVFDEFSQRFEERYIDLRVYAVQDGEGNVTVFPGGLTRVAQNGNRITNNSSGGLCKPTWVAN